MKKYWRAALGLGAFLAFGQVFPAMAMKEAETGLGLGSNFMPREIEARLSGYDEVPSVSTMGRGRFRGKISPDGTQIQYELSYRGIEEGTAAFMAHIHFSRRGSNGGISVW